MNNRSKSALISGILILVAGVIFVNSKLPTVTALKATKTPTTLPSTPTLIPATGTVVVTNTAIPVTSTPSASITPYSSAPLCPDSGVGHDYTQFHTLWDSERGCHYDHEHGADPYTDDVMAKFPGFDLLALHCFSPVGGCNPTSPIENLLKHGGMKIQVDLDTPQGCALGFEGGETAIDAYVVWYHAYGPPEVELEARLHGVSIMAEQCRKGNPNDKGYVFVTQHVDYGQMVIPYQGTVAQYPNRPNPGYASSLAPYWSNDCIGNVVQCRASIQFILSRNLNVNAVFTSKSGYRTGATEVVSILGRYRDGYQVFDWDDQTYPFTYRWVCGDTAYDPQGCRYNNSTTTIHEIQLNVLEEWDNLAGFDTDTRVGRITASGFLDVAGNLAPDCTQPNGSTCFYIKMDQAFVGFTSSEVSINKVSNPTCVDTPERDFYFNNGQLVSECLPTGMINPDASPSGWLGANN